MNEIRESSLAQIVNGDHRAAHVFEKYHLDFCCKGKRSLQDACTENKINVEEVVSALKNSLQDSSGKAAIEFEQLSLSGLTEYIVLTHHSYVKKEMPLITGYLQKVAAKHGDRHPELKKVFELFTALREEMTQHMEKEEQVLFPRIREIELQLITGSPIVLNANYLVSPIVLMEDQHDHAGTLLEEIRRLTNGYTPPTDACTTYRLSFAALQAFELDLHQHIHLENNILFPNALKLFRQQGEASLN